MCMYIFMSFHDLNKIIELKYNIVCLVMCSDCFLSLCYSYLQSILIDFGLVRCLQLKTTNCTISQTFDNDDWVREFSKDKKIRLNLQYKLTYQFSRAISSNSTDIHEWFRRVWGFYFNAV